MLIICSCKKSKEAEYDAWANKGIQFAKSYATNWVMTNGVDLQTSNQVSETVDMLAGAAKTATAREVFVKTMEAGEFLLKLHDSNRLPGVAKDEHGDSTIEEVPLMVSNKLVLLAYPVERTFHFVKEGYTSTNNFIVFQKSKNADWKLKRAWETDSNGQTIQEWPVQ